MEHRCVNSSLCGTCLNEVPKASVCLDDVWAKKLEYCLGIELSSWKTSMLCEKCAMKIDEFTEFKEKSIAANQYWISNLANLEQCIKLIDVKDETVDLETTHFQNNNSVLENSELNKDLKNESHSDEEETHSNEYNYQSGSFIKQETNDVYTSIKETVKLRKVKQTLIKANPKRQIKKIKKRRKDTDENKINGEVSYVVEKYCEKCDKHFKSQLTYFRHCQLKHSQLKTDRLGLLGYKCGLCDFSADDKLTRNKHLDNHFKSKDVNCKLCDFAGRDMAEMEIHRYSHYSDERKLECHDCCRPHMHLQLLEFHYRSIHLNEVGGWCKECNFRVRNYKTFRNHVRKHTVHFICDICGHKFLYKHSIIEHLGFHYKTKPIICDYCGQRFSRQFGLVTHIRAKHTEHVPVKCSHCNKTFKSQYSLDKHMKLLKVKKDFKCEVCFKEFSSQKILDFHMVWHKDERPFSCGLCTMSFKSNANLKMHVLTHTSSYKRKCSYCDKGFMAKRSLLIHESIHTGVRLYQCPHCVKSYNHKKEYLKHMATHK